MRVLLIFSQVALPLAYCPLHILPYKERDSVIMNSMSCFCTLEHLVEKYYGNVAMATDASLSTVLLGSFARCVVICKEHIKLLDLLLIRK